MARKRAVWRCRSGTYDRQATTSDPHEHGRFLSLGLTRCRLALFPAKNCHAGGRGFESRRHIVYDPAGMIVPCSAIRYVLESEARAGPFRQHSSSSTTIKGLQTNESPAIE